MNMINKVTLNNEAYSFRGNINTRKLLELADREVGAGRPILEKLRIDKLDRVARYKKSHGLSLYQIYRSCTRKVKRYSNELLADKAARAMEHRLGIKFSTYHCPICEQWHICKAVNKLLKSWD